MNGFGSVLHPAAAHARDVTTLMWWMIGVGAVVWVAVSIALFVAISRRGSSRDLPVPRFAPDDHGDVVVRRTIGGAVLATFAILVSFMAYSFTVGRAEGMSAAGGHDDEHGVTITLRGHQWWWEVVYDANNPNRLVDANEIHVPVQTPIHLQLEAPDVIHSAWIPSLTGKTDLTPGYKERMWFVADTPGVYRGACAEFCGAQHAKMGFVVVAHTKDDFNAWMNAQRQPARSPADSVTTMGQLVFLGAACSACHAIAGTEARATVAPELTHFGSRRTIAAGARPNTPFDLAQWIENPQSIKPGTQMPAVKLSGEQLHALVQYLRSLK